MGSVCRKGGKIENSHEVRTLQKTIFFNLQVFHDGTR